MRKCHFLLSGQMQPKSQSYQTFFLHNNDVFPLSAIRLGHFIEDELFSDDINTQAYQQKSENKVWYD